MPYLRIEDTFATGPRVSALTDAEFRVLMRLLCECARHRSPLVTAATCRELHGLGPARVAQSVDLRLLEELEPGLWSVPEEDWRRYQPADPTSTERTRRWREKPGPWLGRFDAVRRGRLRAYASRVPARPHG